MSVPERPTASRPATAFERAYARATDPWDYESSPYERAKYAATLAALPRPCYGAALELGCSIGVLTAALAARCDTLLAVDFAENALARARARCAALPGVIFRRMTLPHDYPDGQFDLVVLGGRVLPFLG